MCSILTESYDQGLSNKPSYMFLSILVLEISLKQSKSTKHLTGFLRHCRLVLSVKSFIANFLIRPGMLIPFILGSLLIWHARGSIAILKSVQDSRSP